MVFPTSEHHYQFCKLKAHDLGTEAYEVLMEEDAFKVMKLAKHYLPDDKFSDEWKVSAKTEMYHSNSLKYAACEHAHQKLLSSCVTVAEATRDPYWGMGLNVAQTLDCLPEYWPEKNIMGEILMELYTCI